MNNKSSRPGPAAKFQHNHQPVRNVNEVFHEQLTFGQRTADKVTAVLGSWPFIIIQSIILAIWVAINAYLVTIALTNPNAFKAWDPYPYIFLNLVLSLQAAYAGPVVMMSQNRQSDKDRLAAQLDFEVNMKAEQEIKVIMEHLAHHDELLCEIIDHLGALRNK